MFKTRRLAEKCGILVEASQASILELDPDAVRRWVVAHGAAFFRSFAIDVSSFVQFTDRFADNALVHGARSGRQITEDGTVQEVTPGNSSVALHAELALTPRRPDLLWFYCVQAAASGGQTTLGDGVRIWNALGPKTRALFTTNKLRYVTRLLPEALQRQFPELSYEEAIRKVARIHYPGLTVRTTEEGAEAQYVTSAVVQTRWGGELAFANSITGPYQRTRKWLGFDGGDPIPEAVMTEIGTAAEQETVAIQLQAGDLIMIDNSRVMHGRRSFTGERTVYVRMGPANW